MLKEGALPVNVDPADPKIDDPTERARHHARVRARPVGAGRLRAAGAALGRAAATGGWVSELWQLRRGRLFLVPGDFADRIPPAARLAAAMSRRSTSPHLVPADPFARRGAAARSGRDGACISGKGQAGGCRGAERPTWQARRRAPASASMPVRTALAVEPRDGRLCVFMPPVERLEDYLELLAAVEATAAELELPVHIEGYPPPSDPRINLIKVTPDPGVIEVNIHPAASWREAVDITRRSTRMRVSAGSAPTSS